MSYLLCQFRLQVTLFGSYLYSRVIGVGKQTNTLLFRHKALIHALAAKGHNVTVLSTDIETNSPPNVHYIDLDGVYEELHSGFEADFSVMTNPSHPLQNVMFFYMYAEMSCAGLYVLQSV